jgi:hypothetical protein
VVIKSASDIRDEFHPDIFQNRFYSLCYLLSNSGSGLDSLRSQFDFGGVVPRRLNELALNSCRATLCKRFDLFERRHRGIAGECGEQCTVSPTELDRLFRGTTVQQCVNETSGEAIATADAVVNLQSAGRGLIGLPFHPADGGRWWNGLLATLWRQP